MVELNKIIGGVLAGGQSRRMGGQDKSLMKLGKKNLITHVVKRMESQVDHVVINANGEKSRFAPLKNAVVSDSFDGFFGPLAGIHALMEYAIENNNQHTHIITAAADTPFFPTDFVQSCITSAHLMGNSANTSIILAKSAGNRHPVFGLWPITLHQSLTEFLALGETRKVLAFVEMHSYGYAEFEILQKGNANFDPFFNINTLEDLRLANKMLDDTLSTKAAKA